jgi:hypothetical protein
MMLHFGIGRTYFQDVMLFDKLWWAYRTSRRRTEKREKEYEAKLEKARLATYKNDIDRHNAFSEIEGKYGFESMVDEEFDVISTRITIDKARKLGIPLPPKPSREHPYEYGKDPWYFNEITGSTTLTELGLFQVREAIRKEQTERLQHRMRYLNLVAAPVVSFLSGLIGALLGLAVRHSK